VDVGTAVVADEQSFELVQPGEAALDDPAVAAQPGAVLGLAAGDLRFDPALPEQTAVLVVVVAAVGGHPLGATARPSDHAAHARHPVDERDQLGDVVAVAAREREGERNPSRVDEEVVLGAWSASVHRARARFGAPFFACT
jgi:hypothetical protein